MLVALNIGQRGATGNNELNKENQCLFGEISQETNLKELREHNLET